MTQQKRITISSIIRCLDEGMKREEIAKYFDITMQEMREHFKHPKLKGLRRRKKISSILVDDTEDDMLQEIDNPIKPSDDEGELYLEVQEEELEEA